MSRPSASCDTCGSSSVKKAAKAAPRRPARAASSFVGHPPADVVGAHDGIEADPRGHVAAPPARGVGLSHRPRPRRSGTPRGGAGGGSAGGPGECRHRRAPSARWSGRDDATGTTISTTVRTRSSANRSSTSVSKAKRSTPQRPNTSRAASRRKAFRPHWVSRAIPVLGTPGAQHQSPGQPGCGAGSQTPQQCSVGVAAHPDNRRDVARQARQHRCHPVRRVLQIGVGKNHHVAGGGEHPGAHRRSLPPVVAQFDDPVGAARGRPSHGLVVGPVVHDDQLQGITGGHRGQPGAQRSQGGGNTVLFPVGRQHHREAGRGGAAHCQGGTPQRLGRPDVGVPQQNEGQNQTESCDNPRQAPRRRSSRS